MSRDDAVIIDVLKAARLAREFLSDMDLDALARDPKTQSAVLHQLLLMGEAVKRLSENYKNAHAALPWKQIAGMRDVLIHQYDAVDIAEVWKTVADDLPRLLPLLDALAVARPRT